MYNSSQIDFSITPFRHTIDRSYLIDHALTTWVTAPMLIFRHPRDSLRSPFLMPLSFWVWNMILLFIFIVACLITLTMRSDKVKNVTFIRALLNAVGVMCQQGFAEEYRKTSSRLLLFVFILFSSIMYQFYSSYIVGSLLTDPPKTINNLRQLIDSGMEVGVEEVVYSHYFLDTTTDQLAVELYQKRILKNHPGGNYMPVTCGIEKIQKGHFAFHVDTAYAYRLIEEKFTDEEICELHQMYLFPVRPLGAAIAKRSPFKQLITTEFIKLTENGIVSYQNTRWQKKKPKCVKSVTKIKAIDLNDASWVFILLATMITLSFVVAIFENVHFRLVRKMRVKEKCSKRKKAFVSQ
jgi:ionotropic glutamate receptor